VLAIVSLYKKYNNYGFTLDTFVSLQTNEYYNDFLEGSSGIVNLKSDAKFSVNTFAMKLKALVEAGESTGYYAEVVRELDKQKRLVDKWSVAVIIRCKYIYSFSHGC